MLVLKLVFLQKQTDQFLILEEREHMHLHKKRKFNLVDYIDFFLLFDVVIIVSQSKESIMVHEIVENVHKLPRVIWTEVAITNLIDHLFQFRISL